MRVVAATGNAGKLAELTALLSPLGWTVVPQAEFGFTEAIESAPTFVENALIKARHACAQTGLPAIADDSGLEVDALGGAPGIRSARYAGDDASAADNIIKLLGELSSVTNRGAKFRCVIVFMQNQNDPSPLIASGTWQGKIATEITGKNGFGYDPIFIPESQNKTAAQLQPTIKNKLSHRAKALQQLREWL